MLDLKVIHETALNAMRSELKLSGVLWMLSNMLDGSYKLWAYPCIEVFMIIDSVVIIITIIIYYEFINDITNHNLKSQFEKFNIM